MCGIVGIIGSKPVSDDLIEALKRLEYRGYDSAGIATIENGHLERRRAQGKLRNLEKRLDEAPLLGHTGVGHTRWATHGSPTENNAHPHITKSVGVVHNGIIENYREIKTELIKRGHVFESETDTEVIVHLITDHINKGLSPLSAVKAALPQLRGAYAVGIIFSGYQDLMIAARQGSPLAIGFGNDEAYLGSDALALAPFTDTIIYLEDGDIAVMHSQSFEIFDKQGVAVQRQAHKTTASSLLFDKRNHRHFMAKEIYEQPEVLGQTLSYYLDMKEAKVSIPNFGIDLNNIRKITITGCGTAYYAGLVAKYWIERYARISVDIDVASEFRYREGPLTEGGLAVFVSQSGETADTLASLQYCKSRGQKILSIVNVLSSSIARLSDCVMPTLAGPEIGVASTKAFTCQLAVLACLVIAIGRANGTITSKAEADLVSALIEVPRLISVLLQNEKQYENLAHLISKARDVLFLGRGVNYPIAMEGALKLKEISYIHAEGYAAGELKHGPIALIDEKVPVVVVAPKDNLFEKTLSNMQEVAARGGQIILISDLEAETLGFKLVDHIAVPKGHEFINPIMYTIPVQLLAYHTAVVMGTDVDQPRNLAKSVTVE